MKSEAATLSKKRPLSSVLNVVDLTKADAKQQKVVEERSVWLQKVVANPVASTPPAAQTASQLHLEGW